LICVCVRIFLPDYTLSPSLIAPSIAPYSLQSPLLTFSRDTMILPVPTLPAVCHRSASAPRSVSNLERDQRVLHYDEETYEQVEGAYCQRVDVLTSTMMVMVMETCGVTVGRSSSPPPHAPVAHLRPEDHTRSHGSGRPLPAPLSMLLECRSDEDRNMIVRGTGRAISSSPQWGAVAATAGLAGK
jgi:hypothetical protein